MSIQILLTNRANSNTELYCPVGHIFINVMWYYSLVYKRVPCLCPAEGSGVPCGNNKRKFIQADRNITPSTITLYLGVLFYGSIPLGITTKRNAFWNLLAG